MVHLLSPYGSVRLQGSDATLSQALTKLGAYWTSNECYECTMSDVDALHRNRSVFLFRFRVQPGNQSFLISYQVRNQSRIFDLILILIMAALGFRTFCYGESFIPALFVLICLVLSFGTSFRQRNKCIQRFRAAFEE